jgi:hypothetical protein
VCSFCQGPLPLTCMVHCFLCPLSRLILDSQEDRAVSKSNCSYYRIRNTFYEVLDSWIPLGTDITFPCYTETSYNCWPVWRPASQSVNQCVLKRSLFRRSLLSRSSNFGFNQYIKSYCVPSVTTGKRLYHYLSYTLKKYLQIKTRKMCLLNNIFKVYLLWKLFSFQ